MHVVPTPIKERLWTVLSIINDFTMLWSGKAIEARKLSAYTSVACAIKAFAVVTGGK